MPTYFVRSSGGDDVNAGTSFAAAFATIQKAIDTAVGDDTVLICNDGTHTPAVQIDTDTNLGTGSAYIMVRGCAADGTDDGTMATISGSAMDANIDIIVNTIFSYYFFENLRFTAAKRYAFNFATKSGMWIFRNCKIDSCVSDGIYWTESAGVITFYDCEIYGNGGCGIDNGNNAARGVAYLYNCSIHDNTDSGLWLSPGTVANRASSSELYNCLIYDNGADGLKLSPNAGSRPKVSNCTIYGNTGDGIDINSTDTSLFLVIDTILSGNGGYGINFNSSTFDWLRAYGICSYGNSTAHTDINGGTIPGVNHIIEDPNFVSVTDGSENFTPQNANLKYSWAFKAGGTSYRQIGAIQPEASESVVIAASNQIYY